MGLLLDRLHIPEEKLRQHRDQAQHWNVPHDRTTIPDRCCNLDNRSRIHHSHCRSNPADSRVLLDSRTDAHGSATDARTNGHATSLWHNVERSARELVQNCAKRPSDRRFQGIEDSVGASLASAQRSLAVPYATITPPSNSHAKMYVDCRITARIVITRTPQTIQMRLLTTL